MLSCNCSWLDTQVWQLFFLLNENENVLSANMLWFSQYSLVTNNNKSKVPGQSGSRQWTGKSPGHWSDLWPVESHSITFLIWVVYDVLPSPANFFTWGKVETPNCSLCSVRGNIGAHPELLLKSSR